jgi:hypothetical protein
MPLGCPVPALFTAYTRLNCPKRDRYGPHDSAPHRVSLVTQIHYDIVILPRPVARSLAELRRGSMIRQLPTGCGCGGIGRRRTLARSGVKARGSSSLLTRTLLLTRRRAGPTLKNLAKVLRGIRHVREGSPMLLATPRPFLHDYSTGRSAAAGLFVATCCQPVFAAGTSFRARMSQKRQVMSRKRPSGKAGREEDSGGRRHESRTRRPGSRSRGGWPRRGLTSAFNLRSARGPAQHGGAAVPVAGVEPARTEVQRLVRPLRLPIPPHRHFSRLRTMASERRSASQVLRSRDNTLDGSWRNA